MGTLSAETSPGLSDAEVAEINAKAAFASKHLFDDPALRLSYYDMYLRQRIARLVETIPQDGWWGYGITEANRAKVAWILWFYPDHNSRL
jgi:hypothetical protein